MKLLSNNLKKAGYFNSVLIIVAIVLRILSLGNLPIFVTIDSIICIAALVFGLFYSLNGYKKDAAKYYKGFMYLYFVSCIFSFLVPIFRDKDVLTMISNAIVLVAAFILAFVKDLGEKKSTYLSLTVLLFSVIKFFYKITNNITFSAKFGNLILAIILCVFVAAKYADKEARGAK